jgi:hypothetical protein
MPTLTIKHEIKHTKSGIVLVASKRTSVVDITGIYDDGSVRTKSGDVWKARKLDNGNYETV